MKYIRPYRILIAALTLVALMSTAALAAKEVFSKSADVPATVTFSGATLTVAGQAVTVPAAEAGGTLTLTIKVDADDPDPTFTVAPTLDCVTITAGPVDAGAQLTATFVAQGTGKTTTKKVTVSAKEDVISATICAKVE